MCIQINSYTITLLWFLGTGDDTWKKICKGMQESCPCFYFKRFHHFCQSRRPLESLFTSSAPMYKRAYNERNPSFLQKDFTFWIILSTITGFSNGLWILNLHICHFVYTQNCSWSALWLLLIHYWYMFFKKEGRSCTFANFAAHEHIAVVLIQDPLGNG